MVLIKNKGTWWLELNYSLVNGIGSDVEYSHKTVGI
jgi:hypothetical protein